LNEGIEYGVWGIEAVTGGGWQPRVEVGTAPSAVLSAKVQIGLRPVQKCKSQVVAVSGWRLGTHQRQSRRYRWRVAGWVGMRCHRIRLDWVGAPLRGVRGRIDVIGSDYLPGSSSISLRTDATPSRPYQRLTKRGQPTLDAGLKGRPETGRMLRGIHSRVPGLSPQVSGTGYQVQVRVRGDSFPNRQPLTASTYYG